MQLNFRENNISSILDTEHKSAIYFGFYLLMM